MELKVMEEVHEVNYPTYEDSKNNLWKLILSSKNVSIGVLCIYLLINNAIAASATNIELAMGVMPAPIITPKEIVIRKVGLLICILVVAVIIRQVIKGIKNTSTREEEKKE